MSLIFSIIIPCYNSEKFIGNTVEMLLRQDLSDCELILVNDGSTDDTLPILQKYESAESNIRVIDQPNRGVSVARNTGVLAACGQYVYFLDSDDTLTDGTMEHFKQVVSEHPDCQMFTFGYETRRDGVKYKSYVTPGFDKQTFSGDILQESFLKKKLSCNICSCIYGRGFLLDNQLRFKQGIKIGEDIVFLLQAMSQVNKAYYSKRLSFIYQIRRDSAMQGYSNYSDDNLISFLLIKNSLSDMDERLYHAANFFISISFISNVLLYLKSRFCSANIENSFLREKEVLYRPMSFVASYSLIIYLFRLLPLRLLFKTKTIRS